MTEATRTLLSQVLELPLEDRAELVELIFDSLTAGPFSTPEIMASWQAEIEKRATALDQGEDSVPLDQAWKRIAGEHA